MKKLINSLLTLILLSIAVVACSGDSYQKRIDKEKKAIKNFIADNKITTRHTYPKDHIFAENEYFLEPGTGIYIRVIDPGDLTDTLDVKDLTTVSMRFDSVLLMVKYQYQLGNNTQETYGIIFQYGNLGSYTSTNTLDNLRYTIMSPACVLPLQKGLGKNAEVSLIVPFRNGSTYQASSLYEPFYFPRISYTFNKPERPDDTEKSEIEKLNE